MGIEPTVDDSGRRPLVLKTRRDTSPDPLPRRIPGRFRIASVACRCQGNQRLTGSASEATSARTRWPFLRICAVTGLPEVRLPNNDEYANIE